MRVNGEEDSVGAESESATLLFASEAPKHLFM